MIVQTLLIDDEDLGLKWEDCDAVEGMYTAGAPWWERI